MQYQAQPEAKLTRRQQLGIDPIPPHMQHQNTVLDPTGAVMASGPQMVPNMQYLPPGITPADYANMPPEHKYIVDKQMITAQ